MIQDFIMITDIISLPRLVELFGESQYSRRNLEERLISEIDVVDPNVLSNNCRKQTVSYIFKFDPTTIAFTVMLLSLFEIKKLKIDELEQTRPMLNNDKLKMTLYAIDQENKDQNRSKSNVSTDKTPIVRRETSRRIRNKNSVVNVDGA